MGDRAGRLEAQSRGIVLIGSAAVIGLARTEGLISAARLLLERLTPSGYHLGQAVIAAGGVSAQPNCAGPCGSQSARGLRFPVGWLTGLGR